MTKNEKISASLKERYKTIPHQNLGKPGTIQTIEMKEHKRLKQLEYWDRTGRASEIHKKARNKANVYAYRARLQNAIPFDADLKLITKIYEYCPDGYHVDHIVALASSGLHHQDNLQYLPISENCRKGKGNKYDESLIVHWRTLVKE